MDENPDLARVARLLADPARARILRALLDGTMRPAGELAFAAQISAQSASAHLAKLTRGGLLALQAQGRHRYFRLASPQVADAVEVLGSLGAASAPRRVRPPAIPKATPAQFLRSRTCYDHSRARRRCRWVRIDARKRAGSLRRGARFPPHRARRGERLAALQLDVAAIRRSRRGIRARLHRPHAAAAAHRRRPRRCLAAGVSGAGLGSAPPALTRGGHHAARRRCLCQALLGLATSAGSSGRPSSRRSPASPATAACRA